MGYGYAYVPSQLVRFKIGNLAVRYTFGFTRLDVNLIVSCPFVRNPLHTGGQAVDDLLIKSADAFRGNVASIDTNDPRILARGLKSR